MNTHRDSSSLDSLLSVQRVGELLSVDPSTVRRYIERGQLPSIKLGGRRLVAESDLRNFIETARASETA